MLYYTMLYYTLFLGGLAVAWFESPQPPVVLARTVQRLCRIEACRKEIRPLPFAVCHLTPATSPNPRPLPLVALIAISKNSY